jgi:hypothetical protein
VNFCGVVSASVLLRRCDCAWKLSRAGQAPPLQIRNKKRRGIGRGAEEMLLADELCLADYFDGFLHVVMSLVDVVQGALLEALSEAVVFFAGDVVVRLVEQFGGAAETAAPLEVSVDWRVIVQVLAVFDGGLLDLGDGVIDFVDGFLFLITQFPAVGALQVSSGGA